MQKYGLNKLNKLVTIPKNPSLHQLNQRIKNSIQWFGKACSGQSVGESFISLAIAIESLLSQGRTNKETKSLYIANLVGSSHDQHMSPIPQYVSKEFLNGLSKAKNQSEKMKTIYERSNQLFEIRNKLVHGSAGIEAIDPIALIDFEALVRNSILSVVSLSWKNEKDFVNWGRKIRSKNANRKLINGSN